MFTPKGRGPAALWGVVVGKERLLALWVPSETNAPNGANPPRSSAPVTSRRFRSCRRQQDSRGGEVLSGVLVTRCFPGCFLRVAVRQSCDVRHSLSFSFFSSSSSSSSSSSIMFLLIGLQFCLLDLIRGTYLFGRNLGIRRGKGSETHPQHQQVG